MAPVVPLSIQFNSTNYPNPTTASARADVTSTAGVMKNINGSEANNGPNFLYIPLGGNALLLDRIQMTATTAGVVDFSSEVLNPVLEQTVLASGTGQQNISDALTLATNQIAFGSASVTVVNAPPTPSTISGTVYVDSNGDNTFDTGDSGLGNVTVGCSVPMACRSARRKSRPPTAAIRSRTCSPAHTRSARCSQAASSKRPSTSAPSTAPPAAQPAG